MDGWMDGYKKEEVHETHQTDRLAASGWSVEMKEFLGYIDADIHSFHFQRACKQPTGRRLVAVGCDAVDWPEKGSKAAGGCDA